MSLRERSHALADITHTCPGRAHGLKVPKKPKYTAFDKDPAKYLDLKEYLPDRSSLTEDFKWVKPCSMTPEQLLAWASHLYERQKRKKNEKRRDARAADPQDPEMN